MRGRRALPHARCEGRTVPQPCSRCEHQVRAAVGAIATAEGPFPRAASLAAPPERDAADGDEEEENLNAAGEDPTALDGSIVLPSPATMWESWEVGLAIGVAGNVWFVCWLPCRSTTGVNGSDGPNGEIILATNALRCAVMMRDGLSNVSGCG